jgi:nucleoside-diphosphate-sugar epimerase
MDLLPQADAVIALWGVTPSPGADLAANTELALTAMEIGRVVGADRVVHCSSAAVYAAARHALGEDTPPDPPSAYGRAKWDMERALSDGRRPGWPAAICLRIGNVAGAESLFGAMTRADDIHLDRFPDGAGPDRSYIAPTDLAHVLARLATVPVATLPSVLNVAAPVVTPMEAIARAAGRRVIWRSAPAGAVRSVALDTTRLNALCALRADMACPDHLVSDWLRWKKTE